MRAGNKSIQTKRKGEERTERFWKLESRCLVSDSPLLGKLNPKLVIWKAKKQTNLHHITHERNQGTSHLGNGSESGVRRDFAKVY